MKAIKLLCKTAGFNHGDTPEIGKGKGQIKADVAEGLVEDGLAVEMKVVEVSAKDSNSAKVAELESKVTELEKANEALAGEKAKLESKVTELEKANEASAKKTTK